MNKSDKKLLMMIGVVVLCFILFFAARFLFGSKNTAPTLDELHKLNVIGEAGEPHYVYNGFSFILVDNLWYTQIKLRDSLVDIPLHFAPNDLEDIPVSGAIDDNFKKSSIYISFNPYSEGMQYVALSSAELSINLVKALEIIPIAACDRNETFACEDRPIKTCDSDDAVIYVQESNETGVILEGNCVTVKGAGWDLVKATDRLLLQWYGVMK